ncbi:cubilin, partial [Elysia marginata]
MQVCLVLLLPPVCGGRLTQLSASIETPNYPEPHPQDMDCVWRITAPEGHQIRLKVVDFQLESSDNCSIDYLEIRNGNFSDSPLMGKFCSNNMQAGTAMYSSSNSLYLNFVSTSYFFGFERGFKINYDSGATGCGGLLSTATGGFRSPHYPHQNPHSSECFWTITVSAGNRLNLYFDHLDLESDSDCSVQFVEVRDSDRTGQLLGRFCDKSATPEFITSVTNSLWVKYRSQSSYSGTGFSARYDINCSSVNFESHVGVIESPNYPESYPYKANCSWRIQAPIGNTFKLHIVALKLETGLDDRCGADNLTFMTFYADYDIPNDSKTLCGYWPPQYIETIGDVINLQFVSDDLKENEGFRLEWQVIGCGGGLSALNGHFQLQNATNEGAYQCEWTITVPLGRKINLEITKLDLECKTGSVEVYAGRNRDGPRLLHQCHSTSSSLMISSPSNTMFVYLHYQDYSPKFEASYKSVDGGCGGRLTAHSGVLLSEEHTKKYPPDSECEWLLELEKSYIIAFSLQAFQMETDQYCNTSYVKIYDGSSSNAPLIKSFCGGDKPNIPATFKSKSNMIFVHLQTGGKKSSYIFDASYTTSCGATLNADKVGSIFSHAFGPQECLWYIVSKIPTRKVSMTVVDFELSCEKGEYLYFTDGLDPTPTINGASQNKYCGNSFPPTFYSQGSAMTVKLVTKGQVEFEADYSSADDACGGKYKATDSNFHGQFISPWYPDNYPNNLECVWELEPLAGNGIELSFLAIELEVRNSSFEKIFIERCVNGKNIARLYGLKTAFTKTFTDKVWIKFRTNKEGTSTGFTATWGPSFVNYLTQNQGKLDFLNGKKDTDYKWIITVDEAFKVNLTVFFLCTGSSNYVKIYDGAEREGGILFKQEQSMSDKKMLISSTNQITIKVRVRSSVKLTIIWNSIISEDHKVEGCGSILKAQNFPQNLTSPGYPDNYPDNTDCWWIIKAPLSSTVVVNITTMAIERQGPDCASSDYVEFLDGGSRKRRSLGQYCGSKRDSLQIRSLHHTLEVHFKSDKTRNFTGFVLSYEIGCGGMLNPASKISSPNYPEQYPPYQNCTWQVSALPGRTILLDFEENFSIAEPKVFTPNSSCSGDYIQLFNGEDSYAPPLVAPNSSSTDGKYCGTVSPRSTETGSSFLMAEFISDKSGSGSGFSFNVSEVEVGCGGHLDLTYERPSGYFTSPNYPRNYSHNLDCIWVIKAPPTKEVQVDFKGSFSVEYSE